MISIMAVKFDELKRSPLKHTCDVLASHGAAVVPIYGSVFGKKPRHRAAIQKLFLQMKSVYMLKS